MECGQLLQPASVTHDVAWCCPTLQTVEHLCCLSLWHLLGPVQGGCCGLLLDPLATVLSHLQPWWCCSTVYLEVTKIIYSIVVSYPVETAVLSMRCQAFTAAALFVGICAFILSSLTRKHNLLDWNQVTLLVIANTVSLPWITLGWLLRSTLRNNARG